MNYCTVDTCNRKRYAYGLCSHHHYLKITHGDVNYISTRQIHGLTNTKQYWAWRAMLNRCYDKNSSVYQYYGGRGILVCDRWKNSCANYVLDIGDKPGKGYSIDRIDNDGNYEPNNVRWATRLTQAINRRVYANNKSGFRGVCYDTKLKKFRASITDGDKRSMHLGQSVDPEMAALMYDVAAIQLRGELAMTNYV